jgi:2-keto-3-deoxy-L-rhamnonate aldolase RhmA
LLKSDFAAGVFCLIPNEAIVEIIGYSGFDFMVFDTEHGTYDLAMIDRLARPAAAVGMASVVRIAHPLDTRLVTRVLDTGVDALIFSRVSSDKKRKLLCAARALPRWARWGHIPVGAPATTTAWQATSMYAASTTWWSRR